ncbi:MAG: DUF1559 domain-containing protein [Planctomycetaceae bacterium]
MNRADSPGRSTTVDSARCPSDGGEQPPLEMGHMVTSRMRFVQAILMWDRQLIRQSGPILCYRRAPMKNRGVFGRGCCTRLRDITDGSSNTIVA